MNVYFFRVGSREYKVNAPTFKDAVGIIAKTTGHKFWSSKLKDGKIKAIKEDVELLVIEKPLGPLYIEKFWP
jgi:hypothetical protein